MIHPYHLSTPGRLAAFGLAILAIAAAPALCQSAGTINTFAGNGTHGFSGDGGQATKAELGAGLFGGLFGLAVDSQNNLFIADQGNLRVRKVDAATGVITTIAGGGIGVGDGGPATSASVAPGSVSFDGAGNMYIAGGTQVRKVDPHGIITTVAGGALNSFSYSGDGGPATSAGFLITDATVDSGGNIYLCDSINNRVRKVGLDGIINTVAGTGITGFSGDGGPATKAQVALPQGIAVDNKGNFFFADGANGRIRKVDKNGIITTVAGSGDPLSLPFQDNGPATKAGMTPTWVTVDKAGNLYIGDTGGQKVRKVDTKGIVTTYAGGGGPVPGLSGFSGDGGPANKAQLNNPRAVTVDSLGNLYIGDTGNDRIRVVYSGVKPPPPGSPSFSASGVVDGASFTSGGVVPGEIVTIFGNNLTSKTGINLAPSLPLPKKLVNTSVTVNGTAAGLFAVDNVGGQQQINFQVPWEVGTQSTASIVVTNNGLASSAVVVPVEIAQPAIFNYDLGGKKFGAILHADFTLVDAAHPAKAGETVLIYCTGLGAVSSPPADGAPATGQSTIKVPTVAIGGPIALLSFSGLAPGFVGLYQVNAEIPAGLPSGNQSVLMIVGAAHSNTVLLPIQ